MDPKSDPMPVDQDGGAWNEFIAAPYQMVDIICSRKEKCQNWNNPDG